MGRKNVNTNKIYINLPKALEMSHAYLKRCYPHDRVDRNLDQIYRRNNWLKRHGYPKRRKPFVPCWVLPEECEKILEEMLRMGLPVEKELNEYKSWRDRNYEGGLKS